MYSILHVCMFRSLMYVRTFCVCDHVGSARSYLGESHKALCSTGADCVCVLFHIIMAVLLIPECVANEAAILSIFYPVVLLPLHTSRPRDHLRRQVCVDTHALRTRKHQESFVRCVCNSFVVFQSTLYTVHSTIQSTLLVKITVHCRLY